MNTQNKLYKWITLTLTLLLVASLLLVPASTPAAASSPMQSYIIRGTNVAQVSHLVAQYGGKVTSQLWVIDGVAADLPQNAVAALQKEKGISQVFPNAGVKINTASLPDRITTPATDYPDITGADKVWKKGVNGKGISVAVIDTGIGWVPGLFFSTSNNLNRIVGWVDFVEGKHIPMDPNGHGTHVAGIIANTDTGADKEWNGMAPGIKLVGVRVLDKEGKGTYEQVLKGIQWVIEKKDRYKIKVINLSLLADVQSPYWADPINIAVMKAYAAGITVVAAAGNDGPDAMSIGVPGNNPYAITVGAFTDKFTPGDWKDDYITPFSASGPTLDGFVKPDVVAPGAHMVSTMLPSTYVARNHQANRVSAQYFSMAGTSQSAAVVSGIAALVLSKYPDLSPAQVKYRIMASAMPWVEVSNGQAVYSMWQQGTGRVNAYDAVFAKLDGTANQGLDVQKDLSGELHYEGYTYFDTETGMFRLKGHETWEGGYGTWSGGAGAWSGGAGAWSGTYGAWAEGIGAWSGGAGAWSGGAGAWSGGAGAWSGGAGAWSGGAGAWSGGYGTWAGGAGAWSGGAGAWSGRAGAWSGSLPWADTDYIQSEFVAQYLRGDGPDASTQATSFDWIEEDY
jgi:serine protease AprX